MKSVSTIVILLLCFAAHAQHIAPEGKIIKDRTLTWADFLGKPDRNEDERTAAAVRPAIYAVVEDVEEHDNGRIAIKFKVKCAFQSAAWVREGIGKEHSQYLLNHEQEHYDIALTFANKLQAELSGRDYSATNYQKEVDDIFYPLLDKYEQTQAAYDNEGNHSLIKEKQLLWDCRIKRCLET
ncbi:MAG: DUF922 domain-containing protein, partial [Chitinophagia bacterium]|nr:DUF922 domain-containing protein [Chitinophagia bacterium]